MCTLIRITDFYKSYLNKFTKTKRIAVENLSLEIEKGQIYGLIGPNGSGKTTTIKAILGFIKPSSGQIEILGKSPLDSKKNRRIGFLPEESYYHDFLTIKEQLEFYGALYNFPTKKALDIKIAEVIELTRIKQYINTFISELSRGNLQRLGIAQSIMNDPELLIYDEPASGIDPVGRFEIRKILTDLSREGKTIFMSSHFLPEVEKLCTHIGIILNGKLLYSGKLSDLNTEGKDLEEKFMNLMRSDSK
ncbi:ABC transporter ATP-binding protein [bacterium]|nr:ABC transporter ATP-binding protein [bacterium]